MRYLFLLASALFSLSAFAATPQETVQLALSKLAPQVKVDAVQESVVPGFYEALVGSQLLYVSKDGRFVLDGNAIDGASQRDITEAARAKSRMVHLAKIGPDKRIIFAPANAKYSVTVFTDIDCPFCRRFHQNIAEYNKQLGAKYYVTGKVYASDQRAEDERRVQYFMFMQVIDVATSAVLWQNKTNVTKGIADI